MAYWVFSACFDPMVCVPLDMFHEERPKTENFIDADGKQQQLSFQEKRHY